VNGLNKNLLAIIMMTSAESDKMTLFKSIGFGFPFSIMPKCAAAGIFGPEGEYRPQLVVGTETHKIILQNSGLFFLIAHLD
jgi:hypothetical protein